MRICLQDPIPQLFEAARFLDKAVSAHMAGKRDLAARLIRLADMREVREWTESLWGANSPHVLVREVSGGPKTLPKAERIPVRMPNASEKAALHARDGFHCRFCGIPVIRKEVRVKLRSFYPEALPWGRTNPGQHAAFQALWLQYDHLLPHAKGGSNDIGNVVITCAPCNYARSDYTIEEVGLGNPFLRDPIRSDWDGLERIFKASTTPAAT